MYCPHCGKSILDGPVFCSFCAKPTASAPSTATVPTPAPAPAVAKKSNLFVPALRIIALVVVIILGTVLIIVTASGPGKGPTTISDTLLAPKAQTEKVISGDVVVRAGQRREWTLNISPYMITPQLTGSFHASGGNGNDIEVIIADASEYENWANGHPANLIYSSDRTTNGNFSVKLKPGKCVLALDNRFSMFAEKVITASIELHYLR